MPIGMPNSKSLNQQQLHQFRSFKVSDIEHRGVQQRTERSDMKNNFTLRPDQLQHTQPWRG